jgi:hypothetical protein
LHRHPRRLELHVGLDLSAGALPPRPTRSVCLSAPWIDLPIILICPVPCAGGRILPAFR